MKEIIQGKLFGYDLVLKVPDGTLPSHIDENTTENYVLGRIREATENMNRAYGGCKNCYGKGYSTAMYGMRGHEDFGGDGFEVGPDVHMVFCSCDRGIGLKKLLRRT